MTIASRASTVIRNILKEDPNKNWLMSDLVSAVSNRMNQTNLNPIKRVLAVMVDTNTVTTTLGGFRTKKVFISHKEEATTGPVVSGVVNTNELNRLLAVNESLMKAVKNAASEIDNLKAEAKNTTSAGTGILEVRTLDTNGEVVHTMEGVFHAKFRKLVDLAGARKNIFIYGPTGCGKSHICSQLAEAMGLPFAFVSCSSGMSEGQVTGKLLPVGNHGKFEYVISEFVRAYETGGVFLVDEVDAADANVLLVMNSALANGHLALSNRPENPYAKRHPDFICVAAANTVGLGSDRMYSGRNKLDAATLDRFAVGKVYLDYDTRIEAALCPNDALRSRLLRYRNAINSARLERVVSTRFMRDAYDMVTNVGWTNADIDETFFAGWREDEIAKVRNYTGA